MQSRRLFLYGALAALASLAPPALHAPAQYAQRMGKPAPAIQASDTPRGTVIGQYGADALSLRYDGGVPVCSGNTFEAKDFRPVPLDETIDACTNLFDSYRAVRDFFGFDFTVQPHILPDGKVRFADDPASGTYSGGIIKDRKDLGRHEFALSAAGSREFKLDGFREPLGRLAATPEGMAFGAYIGQFSPLYGKISYTGYHADVLEGRTLGDIFAESPRLRQEPAKRILEGVMLWLEIERRGYDAKETVSRALRTLKAQFDETKKPVAMEDFERAYSSITGDDISDFLKRVNYVR